MTRESPLFGFELDFSGSLRCIPMAVRFKLDSCGVKLSLRQWSRFGHQDRAELLRRPCETSETIQSYKKYLVKLIETQAHERAQEAPVDSHSEWNDVGRVPLRLRNHAVALQLRPPTVEQWASLTPLQRFALYKLTRPGHDNDNFAPAMHEFGLLGG